MGGSCGDSSSTAVFIENGQAVFEFQVPEGAVKAGVKTLRLALRTDGGWWGSPAIAVYDWEANDWSQLGETQMGENPVENPGGLVSPTGQVRVRVEGDVTFKGCYYISLGIESQSAGGQQ
jgi:hypothetical protein